MVKTPKLRKLRRGSVKNKNIRKNRQILKKSACKNRGFDYNRNSIKSYFLLYILVLVRR